MSNSSRKEKYDVFLCFRGEDTRQGFTSYLYEELRNAKIKTFMDEQLPEGVEISQLREKIEKVKVSVVVYSENFASSEWCLEELVRILECREKGKHQVLPIFYKVDSSELTGDQVTGETRKHLAQHENKNGKYSDKIARWRNAVRTFGNLEGKHYSHGDETDFIKEIISEIRRLKHPHIAQMKYLLELGFNYVV